MFWLTETENRLSEGRMGPYICVCVLVCLAVLSGNQQGVSACDQNYIAKASAKCYGDLLTLIDVPAQTDSERLSEVATMCSTVQSSGNCFRNEMQSCSESGATYVDIMDSLFEFVCGEGQDVLLSEGRCWSHEALPLDIAYCTKSMETEFDSRGYNAWCSVTKNYISCIGRKVLQKTECSGRAAEFMQEMYRRSFKPLADKMNCRLHVVLFIFYDGDHLPVAMER